MGKPRSNLTYDEHQRREFGTTIRQIAHEVAGSVNAFEKKYEQRIRAYLNGNIVMTRARFDRLIQLPDLTRDHVQSLRLLYEGTLTREDATMASMTRHAIHVYGGEQGLTSASKGSIGSSTIHYLLHGNNHRNKDDTKPHCPHFHKWGVVADMLELDEHQTELVWHRDTVKLHQSRGTNRLGAEVETLFRRHRVTNEDWRKKENRPEQLRDMTSRAIQKFISDVRSGALLPWKEMEKILDGFQVSHIEALSILHAWIEEAETQSTSAQKKLHVKTAKARVPSIRLRYIKEYAEKTDHNQKALKNVCRIEDEEDFDLF